MRLVRLAYYSKARADLTEDEIRSISEHAAKSNYEKAISGTLCYSNCYFLQCLEGAHSRINQLYNTIAQDSRHSEVYLISYKDIYARYFSDWGMFYMGSDFLTGEFYKRFLPTERFFPERFTDHAADAFFQRVGETTFLQ